MEKIDSKIKFAFYNSLIKLNLPKYSTSEMTTIYNIDLGITDAETYSIQNKSLKLDSEKDVSEIATLIQSIKLLKKVDLSGNTISPISLKAIIKAISINSKDSLVELNLQDIFTSRNKEEIQESFENLIPILPEFTKLQVLNLSDNAIGQEAIGPLCSILSKLTTLKHLILTNNGLGPFSGAKLGKALHSQYQITKNGGLETFWCGRNRLENGSIDYLSIGLRQHSNLKEIRMYQNGIRPVGISKFLNQCVSKLNKLEVLDLQDNTFTLSGSLALTNILKNLISLKELNLSDCLLGKKGGMSFVQSLGQLSDSKLEILKLQYNELDEPVIELLSRTLHILKKLKFLDLNGNIFDEDAEFVQVINNYFEEKGFGELGELDELEEPDSDEEEESDNDESDEESRSDADLDALEEELTNVHI